MKSLSRSDILLKKALEDLLRRWNATETHWRDKARKTFDTDCIQPLETTVKSAANAMTEITLLLDKAMKECGG